MKLDLPNLVYDPDERGNHRYYVRVKVNGGSRKMRLKQPAGSPEFLEEYNAALRELRAAAGKAKLGRPEKKLAPGHSLGWLAARYFASPEFQSLDPKSQSTRRGVIEACLEESLTPGSKLIMRDCPYARVNAQHIKMLRDRKKNTPGAANNRFPQCSAGRLSNPISLSSAIPAET